MSTTTDTTWEQHPLVTHAIVTAGPSAQPIDVASALMDTMHELEDRYPGVPFEMILTAPRAENPDEIARQMLACGVSPDNIKLATGIKPRRYTPAAGLTEDLFEHAQNDTPVTELQELGYSESAIRAVRTMLKPMSAIHLRVAQACLDRGMSIKGAATEFGASASTVKDGIAKEAYKRWLDPTRAVA